jgi:hypothetical protein
MSLARLIARFFSSRAPSSDNDFHLPRLGESRPTGHFREFTTPRRLQRGGVAVRGNRRTFKGTATGIVPCAGENIP